MKERSSQSQLEEAPRVGGPTFVHDEFERVHGLIMPGGSDARRRTGAWRVVLSRGGLSPEEQSQATAPERRLTQREPK